MSIFGQLEGRGVADSRSVESRVASIVAICLLVVVCSIVGIKSCSSSKTAKKPRAQSSTPLVANESPLSPPTASTDGLMQDYSETSAQLLRLHTKYPMVTIRGKILDRGEGVIEVWGTAASVDSRPNALGALYEDSNILVIHPDEQSIHSGYYIGATHYFLEKRYGKNSFGQPVPLWVYGDEPAELRNAREHFESLVKQLDARSAESAPARWKGISKIFASVPNMASEAERSDQIERLNESLHSLASFRSITFGSSLSYLSSYDADRRATLGDLDLYVFSSEGIIASTYQGRLASLSYLADPDVVALYYSWIKRIGRLSAFCGPVPAYSPVAYENGDLARLGYGGGRDGRDFLNEFGITDFWIDRRRPGLESSLVYITDGIHTRIIGIEVYDLSRITFPLKDLPLNVDQMDGNPSPQAIITASSPPCSSETLQPVSR